VSLIYRFDEFELDTLRFELRRAGAAIRVQPKVLRLLFHLVANRDRSVSTRELLETLWPGEAVTVASVKRAIAGARRALGELAESASSIRTVRGHGYRFVREVRAEGSEAPSVAANVAEAAANGRPPSATAQVASSAMFLRAPTIATLDGVLAEARERCSRPLLIRGAPGTGKSTTLRELSRRARAEGALVLWARCTAHDGVPPLWPVVQMLRQAAGELDSALLRPVMEQLAASNQFGLVQAFASLLSGSSERHAILVAIDDLTAADSATLQLLATAATQLEHTRVLFAAAMRPLLERERTDRPALRAVESALSARRIELDELSSSEFASLAAQRIDTPLSPAELATLVDWTGGNPRLCDHVLRSGSFATTELEQYALRSDVAALIEQQVSALPQPARALLRTAAVIGRQFSLATLARALELPAERALAQLQDAVTLGFLIQTSVTPPEYRFRCVLVHEGLALHLPHAERAEVHARIASALEAHCETDDPALLARIADHWLRANPTTGGSQAFDAAVRVARDAMKRGAYEVAAAYFDRALQASELAAPGAQARLRLQLEKTSALVCLGHVDAASECAQTAARLALEVEDVSGLVEAARLLGRLPLPDCSDTSQRVLFETALAALPRGDARRASIEALWARAQVWSRDPKLRATRAISAFTAARAVSDPAERGEALRACLHALADPEFLSERLAIAEELEGIGREREDRELLTTSACARIWAYCELGDMPGIDASIRTLELLAQQTEAPFARWNAKVFRAMRAIISGQLDAAARFSHEALAIGEKLGRANAYHVHCTQISGIHRLQGQLERAVELVREVSLRHPAIAGWQAALAGLEAELGRERHAREVLKRLLDRDLAALLGDPYGLGALAPAADLCAQVGDAEQARRVYELLLPYAHRHGVISMGTNTHGPLARHLGRLAMRMNNAAAAEWHLKRAIEEAERCESPTFTSLGCLAYAQLSVAADRPAARAKAAALTSRALQLGMDFGLHAIVDRARNLAQRNNLALRRVASAS
jgi:eukaryotic-like serine/threonine-protein kinase